MAGEVSFFELGVDDPERARTFYGGLFGWEFDTVTSGGGFAIRAPGVPGGVHGGDPGASPYVFFRVDDLELALAEVVRLGGSVETPAADDEPESVARFGRFAFCRDDQGSPFGLHQAPGGG
ncbi:VOC family protein [Streptomyces stramineus]|uniref:VOC family protein n=1 Tax=Streptomyces stramineus TaxID=173861 RepID=A0ABP3K8I6_9ACTN